MTSSLLELLVTAKKGLVVSSPDSTLLGFTETYIKSLFVQSGLVFPQLWVFEDIFEVRGQNLLNFFLMFVPFILLKTTVPILGIECKNCFKTDYPWLANPN